MDMESILFGGKGPRAAFKKGDPIGLEVGGVITKAPEVVQQTDLKDGKLLYWDDGKPKMQIIVTIQTALREDAEDDGLRRFFLKQSTDQLRAVSTALEHVGKREVEEGGFLAIRYIGDGTSTTPGYNAPRLHSAIYSPPKITAQSQILGTTGQPPVTPPIQPAATAYQPPAYQQQAPQAPAQPPVYQQPAPQTPPQQQGPVHGPTAASLGISEAAFAAIAELTAAQQRQQG
ncbi:hypothetical protein F5X71_34820 [Nocardia brasiliensis]|uniref:Uncharacterized protein n=1 Tax=Nocardia brasiliensis TaxID=37326 RepID=A0A6G9Y0R8_NOCBR|nr:hypothetical protein [Nocardia brasiliensis]QIS06799.1 hypothetical protein F5X71_34820 [Nocardia brasiliensis]